VRRLILGGIGLSAILLLSGCGTSSLTLVVSSPAASVVVTSDSDAIKAFKPKVQQQLAATGETLVDGDQHSGNRVCGFSSSKNGHTYQVDVYGSAPAQTCNQQAQQQFQSQLP
jgi:hypothetical protein